MRKATLKTIESNEVSIDKNYIVGLEGATFEL